MTSHQLVAISSAICVVLCSVAVGQESKKPVPLPTDQRSMIVKLPDGTLMGNFTRTVDEVEEAAARYSTDNGLTWTERETLFKLPAQGGAWAGPEALVDQDGEVHLFFLKWDDVGTELPGQSDGVIEAYLGGYSGKWLNVWHTKSTNGRTEWRAPKLLWKGYTGAMNSVIQMANGRIVFPFAEYVGRRVFGAGGDDLQAFTFWGPFQSTAIYSDDAGDTWHPSPSSLGIEVPSIIHGYGADEPVVLQLKDGRVWMLMRTQRGRLFESFSEDGAAWSPLRPTNLISSDSPTGLVRLDDGRIVLFWNCCLRFPYAFGGRHVLHAAISDDEGQTWRGYREVARDPKRHVPPPEHGDFGTAYPFPTVANDGKVIYCTGQGEGRVLLMMLDPEWLLETSQKADFSDAQEEWSIFGTRGVEFVEHQDNPGAQVLSIRKAASDWPACAVWNFPNGLEGRLRMRLMLNRRFKGALVGLTDHFSTPFDIEDQAHNLFNLQIPADGQLSEGARLRPGRWHDLTLEWSVPKQECRVTLDGKDAGTLRLSRDSTGACYLRLRSTAEATDRGGFAVESVEVEVSSP